MRGSGHDKDGMYTEDSDAYQEVVHRLARKHKLAATVVPAPEIHTVPAADIGIVLLGGCHAAFTEAIDLLRNACISADYMRLKAFPIDAPCRAFLDAHAVTFVVETHRDAPRLATHAHSTRKHREQRVSR